MIVFVGLLVRGVSAGEGAGTLLSFRPFASIDAELIPMISGATILCFSFLGFDGISSLSEETPNAGKVIPKAIFLTALIGGLIFIAVSYFLQLYFRMYPVSTIRKSHSLKLCTWWPVPSSSPSFWCSPA